MSYLVRLEHRHQTRNMNATKINRNTFVMINN